LIVITTKNTIRVSSTEQFVDRVDGRHQLDVEKLHEMAVTSFRQRSAAWGRACAMWGEHICDLAQSRLSGGGCIEAARRTRYSALLQKVWRSYRGTSELQKGGSGPVECERRSMRTSNSKSFSPARRRIRLRFSTSSSSWDDAPLRIYGRARPGAVSSRVAPPTAETHPTRKSPSSCPGDGGAAFGFGCAIPLANGGKDCRSRSYHFLMPDSSNTVPGRPGGPLVKAAGSLLRLRVAGTGAVLTSRGAALRCLRFGPAAQGVTEEICL